MYIVLLYRNIQIVKQSNINFSKYICTLPGFNLFPTTIQTNYTIKFYRREYQRNRISNIRYAVKTAEGNMQYKRYNTT